MRKKNMTNEYKYFPETNVAGFFVLVYANEDTNPKRFNAQKYFLPKDIIKNDNIIIIGKSFYIIISGKNFYDQAIDSDIKRHEKV